MKFFVIMGLMLSSILISYQSHGFEGLYFRTSEGEEIKVIPQYKKQRITSISFETDCSANNGYCLSNQHTDDILEAFINSTRNQRLYTYRYVTVDPCMDPRNHCTPFSSDEIQSTDSAKRPDHLSPMRTVRSRTESNAPQNKSGPLETGLEHFFQQLGTSSATLLIEYLKSFNGQGDAPQISINQYRLSNGKKVPLSICRPSDQGCDNIDMDVTVNTNSGVTVTFRERVDSAEALKRYHTISESLWDFFEAGEHTCVVGNTGTESQNIMRGQLICFWNPY
ncbi:hypothetical protein [Pseudoalteromonas luteoviolacea]|uniref:Uncharacterized protein n=1 Tax=Pseudoalteromonas luteoviolacea S4054 TaxID=1129367 RepID=A0A0F6A6M5_9GAMM|nr:hypothetical protein [Pseudoalteromonas luteoviolacea]AOT10883.1 hypothetical protein S4054249_23860 [Pseudoalteromonas luteoviolacea]AOT15954.1 hypothetical protein S40542_24650 [Pseudoalteromonas luteoviolacea]AOT20704.1 hypothetical protein S4054_23780 [Pseudoalteromonas luteoviolacea]KKE81805.1 hypothetical protein N479_02265 [Pseudoalteromonas luteoviolacea S4054]KZN66237.1 hypothetical protein N481_24815 [Pseudoalteromonas luteoviolacea S4047-1]